MSAGAGREVPWSVVGFYSRYIFPRVLDWAMSRQALAEERPGVLAGVGGSVLEIGFGTGLNLPHYPPHVRELTVVEPNPGALRRSRRRAAASPIRVQPAGLVGGRDLPLPDERFDSVVSTWTLCTIPDVAHALAEVHRVLRPGGRFFFIEHGLSPDPRVARWQNRLNGLNKLLGDGCNLNRDIAGLISASPLRIDRCDRFYLRDTPRIGGYMFRGTARKPAR